MSARQYRLPRHTNSFSHDVAFTVRSDEKGQLILDNHPHTPKSKLSYVIVEDISLPNAFDEAVTSDPPFEAVLHTASPFHYNAKNAKKEILDPAMIGSTSILSAIKKSAPSVKRVVITSSFAAMMNPDTPHETYNEKNWNPISWDDALKSEGHNAYRASKKFAETAVWDFVEKEKPNFSVATINPALAIGPIFPYLNPLDKINTSNQPITNMLLGKFKDDGLPPTGLYIWVDARDVALAHVLAAEVEEAGGKRFFCVAGYQSNGIVAQIIADNFPQYRDKLPKELESDLPKDVYGFDNTRSKEILGLKYRALDDTVRYTVLSLQKAGA